MANGKQKDGIAKGCQTDRKWMARMQMDKFNDLSFDIRWLSVCYPFEIFGRKDYL